MARIETGKAVNPTQLCVELGRVALKVRQGEYVESDAVDEATLRAGVDAHVADPDYADPEYVAPPDPDDEFRAAVESAVADEPAGSPLRKLAGALLGTTAGPGAQPRRGRPDQ